MKKEGLYLNKHKVEVDKFVELKGKNGSHFLSELVDIMVDKYHFLNRTAVRNYLLVDDYIFTDMSISEIAENYGISARRTKEIFSLVMKIVRVDFSPEEFKKGVYGVGVAGTEDSEYLKKEMETMDKCFEFENHIKKHYWQYLSSALMVALTIAILVIFYFWLYVLPSINNEINEVCHGYLTEDQMYERYSE